jgi:hypothetical protein
MRQRRFDWSRFFKDLYGSRKVRVGVFFTVSTYIYLVKSGLGPLFSLIVLIPSSFLVAMIFFFILEEIILPLYKWLIKEK